MSLEVNISEPEEFDCIELHSCLVEVAKSRGMEDFIYHVDYLTEKGRNYIANIFRVLLKQNGNHSEDKQMNVIVKTLVNTMRQELFHELHKREVIVYENVIPKFREIQDILKEVDKLALPECLYSKKEKGHEVLILKDLLSKGFKMDDTIARFEILSYETVELVMKELAKFHALSFVCEKKDPECYDEIKNKFNDIIFDDDFLNKSKLRNYFSDSFKAAIQLISDVNIMKKLERIEGDLLNILKDYMKPRKFNVLCHGDCWINNMLFKYDENENGKICFIDFQAMRYASPVTDIIYFMYLCTDSEFRAKHFLSLQDIYYSHLKDFLENFHIDVKDCYPKDEFTKDINEYLPYGLIIALIELKIVTTTSEDDAILRGSNIALDKETNVVPGETELFKIRLNDVVTECVLNGVVDRIVEKIKD